jgi:hypothetical protein
LLLATKGHKGLVAKEIIAAVSDIDADVARQPEESEESETSLRSSQAVHSHDDGSRFRAVKGTVLLHLSFATKQDQVRWYARRNCACVCVL